MPTAHQIAPGSLNKPLRPILHPGYRRFIRLLPCCVCGEIWSIEASHTGNRGLGTKASDLDCIPLCRKHHTSGQVSYHKLGRRKFEAHHKVSIPAVIVECQRLAVEAGIVLNLESL